MKFARPCPSCGAPTRVKHPPPCHPPSTRHRPPPSARGYDGEYQANRKRLLASHPQCHWCPRRATTADHLTPVSQGGTNDLANLVPACHPCNSARTTRRASAFTPPTTKSR